jgi:hypothetical protein
MGSVSDSSALVAATRAHRVKEAAKQHFSPQTRGLPKAKDRLSKAPLTAAFEPKLEQ